MALDGARRIANEYGLSFSRLYEIGVFPVKFPTRSGSGSSGASSIWRLKAAVMKRKIALAGKFKESSSYVVIGFGSA
jgi:hypothetical protein